METDNQKKNAAFNLVELMVAIAVIAILAALLITVVSRAKARGLQIGCANNVRQLGVALQQFKLDHNFYPPHIDSAGGSDNSDWQGALANEMNIDRNQAYTNHGVWHCPAANRPTSPFWNGDNHVVYVEYGYNAYGLGGWLYTNSLGLSEPWGGISTPIPRIFEPHVANPAEMYAIGDGFTGSPGFVRDGGNILGRVYDSVFMIGSLAQDDYPAGTQRSYARHQGHANVVFCDGHVESPTLKFLFVETNDAALVCWNRDHLPHRERLGP